MWLYGVAICIQLVLKGFCTVSNDKQATYDVYSLFQMNLNDLALSEKKTILQPLEGILPGPLRLVLKKRYASWMGR